MDLGCLRAFWSRCRPALFHPKGCWQRQEKALSDCKAQLHILRQSLAKQQTAVSNAKGAFERSQEKLTGLEYDVAKLGLRYRELSVDPLTPSYSKVASEIGDGLQLEEVQSSDDMDLTNRFVEPDPRSPLQAALPKDRIVFLPPAPNAAFVQNEDASKRCRVAAAFSHLKAPSILIIGNRMRGFDAWEQGWVLVQRRRQRRSQGQGKERREEM